MGLLGCSVLCLTPTLCHVALYMNRTAEFFILEQWLKEYCIDSSASGHTYALEMKPFGDETYPMPCEVEEYQGTFFVEDTVEGKCYLLGASNSV